MGETGGGSGLGEREGKEVVVRMYCIKEEVFFQIPDIVFSHLLKYKKIIWAWEE